MKILVVTHETTLSGANKSLLNLIKKLHTQIEFYVLVNRETGELIEQLKELGIPVLFHRYYWWYAQSRTNRLKQIARYTKDFANYYLNLRIDRNFLETISIQQFDIIYTNTSVVDIGARISRNLGIPHVWHIREFGKEDFGFLRLRHQKDYTNEFKNAALCIAISEAVGKKYRDIVDKDKVRVIYNGLEPQNFLAQVRKLHKKDCYSIGMVGQVSEAKGQAIAIRACSELIKEGFNLKLYLAGEVDYAYLKREAPNYKQYEWLEVAGQIKNVNEFRDILDIELICSRAEGFGRVTLEAMLHGIPVIGSDAGGTSELICNEKTGLLFESGNVQQLKIAICKLIESEDLYNNITVNAQQWALGFTIDRTAANVRDVFYEVIKG